MSNRFNQRSIKSKQNKMQAWSGIEVVSLVILLGYLLTEFIANDAKYSDNMHPQWLFLSFLNIVALVFNWSKIKSFYLVFSDILRNMLVLIYLIFLIILGVSIFQAINVFQGFEALSRSITTFFIFLNCTLLLYQIKEKIHVLGKVIVLILLYQSIHILYQFIDTSGPINLDAKIISLVEGFGNKNMTAVGILLKVPFIIFLLDYYRKGFWHILGLLVFAITIFDILLLNARATFLSLGLMILVMIVFSFVYYLKIEKDRALFINVSKIIGIIVLMVFANTIYFSSLKKSKDVEVGGYGSVAERITTINVSQNQNRILLWSWAYDLFKENWAFGCGIGNYKIEVLKIENKTRANSTVTNHAHNDFFEIAGESGIAGFFSYLSIYFFYIFFLFKIIISSNNIKLKKLSVVALMGLVIYFVDATFNFPHERPPVQIYFGLYLALVILLSITYKERKCKVINSGISKIAMFLFFSILISAVYINVVVVKSSVARKLAISFIKENKKALIPKYKYLKVDEIISKFPVYPSINDVGVPIACYKAELLMEEKRYSEALETLKYSKKANPFYLIDDILKVKIFKAISQYDSVMFYCGRLIKDLPNFYEPHFNIGVIEYYRGNIDVAKNHFESAIKLNSNDYESCEHLGIIHYELKNYPLAMEYLTKVIDSRTTNTGKAELVRGWCYHFLGVEEKACADYKRSVDKKNELAIQYLKGCNSN